MSVISRSLGRKILASFLLLAFILITVCAAGIVSGGALHTAVGDVMVRDVEPLTHLRAAQNADHSIVISGFAANATPDPSVKAAMAKLLGEYSATLQQELGALIASVPPDMRDRAEGVKAQYEAFKAADEAFKAGALTPRAAELGNKASGEYQKLEVAFDALADVLEKDAAQQRTSVDGAYRTATIWSLTLSIVGVIGALALGGLLARSVRRRTEPFLDVLGGLAEGDLTRTAEVAGRDELARMATALNAGIASVRGALTEVSGSAATLAASAGGLNGSASATAAAVETAAVSVGAMAHDADDVNRTVGSVAAGTVELGASIREISSNAQEAARIAGRAVGVVESTNATVSQLGNSSQEIGNVIQVIQNIAAQTSLLALNATIEAARAGEAGRGFAVVAGEVKDLARETAEATDSVIQRVQAIQADTEGAVRAISEIGEIIQQINSYQSSIAAAVEEQSVTTDTIGDSVNQALERTQAISEAVAGVSDAARGSADAVSSTRSLAQDLAAMGERLHQVVAAFRV